MRIGVDFDNTIVCFDPLFARAAREKKLIPQTVGASKNDVRDYLRQVGKEERWTELQGDVYGVLVADAKPFPGALDFFKMCLAKRIPVFVVSHKTKNPIKGAPHDLHEAARRWLSANGFVAPGVLTADAVFFELTKEEKIKRIQALNLTHFIDDLPEFLMEPSFPPATGKILFDPARRYASSAKARVVYSWGEARAVIGVENDGRVFFKDAGLSETPTVLPVYGGSNNQSFSVEGNGKKTLLKVYFQHPGDTRNRLETEFRFLQFTAEAGVTGCPRAIKQDAQKNWGLYEFAEGRPMSREDATIDNVRIAAQFFENLNRHRHDPQADLLAPASEACFTIGEHMQLIRERVRKVAAIEGQSQVDQDARVFVGTRLEPLLRTIETSLSTEPSFAKAERCLSPSDFGFHNALVTTGKDVTFVDFEYAGWDDPAKTIVDFFCQPRIPVPMRFYEEFSRRVAQCFNKPADVARRAKLLLPLYRIKWCCILLNEFVRDGAARRQFALDPAAEETRKRAQLDKAISMLQSVKEAM